MRRALPSDAEKNMTIVETVIASNSPGSSCHLLLVSDLNLCVFIAVRKWRKWSKSVITDAKVVAIRVVVDTIEGAPKTSSRLAKKM
jgi:hypothetical protein